MGLTLPVRRTLAASTPAEAVGLPADADRASVETAAKDVFGRMQQLQFVGISAAEDDSRAALSTYLYSLGLGR